ncbi:MAG: hypothetical protein KF729_38635 [Sandaracinaceae bacterium]|nr:hypothetical protein [Sandaracinaceae bacterium]
MTRALVLVAMLGAGCTGVEGHDASISFDAGTDAMGFGYDADYPDAAMVHDCFEAFESVHGAPCAFEGACGAGDLCCRAHAYCSGGRLASVHLDRTCPTATPHPTACASAPVIARGATPLGPVVHEHGVASFAWGFTTDIVLSFTPAAGLVLCEGDRLGLWLASWNVRPEASTPEVTVHDAILQHAVAERVVRAPARVEITRYDYDDDGGRIAGRLRADAPGWDVELDFDLAACPALDRTGP